MNKLIMLTIVATPQTAALVVVVPLLLSAEFGGLVLVGGANQIAFFGRFAFGSGRTMPEAMKTHRNDWFRLELTVSRPMERFDATPWPHPFRQTLSFPGRMVNGNSGKIEAYIETKISAEEGDRLRWAIGGKATVSITWTGANGQEERGVVYESNEVSVGGVHDAKHFEDRLKKLRLMDVTFTML